MPRRRSRTRSRFSAPSSPATSRASSSTSPAASSSSSFSPATLKGVRRRLLFLLLSIVAVVVVLGFVFAGSPTTLATGVTIDGIDVGGLSTKDAHALLQRRSDSVKYRPVEFHAGCRRY